MNKKFERKSVKDIEIKKKKDNKSVIHYFKRFFIIIIVFWIVYFWGNISHSLGNYIKDITWIMVKNLSSTIAKEPEKDNLGNINILLLGIGGENHDGGYLTDSIIILSFNPNHKSLTFLSVPRDLYVKYDNYNGGRINYIFAKEFLQSKSYDKAVGKLEDKLKEVIGVNINYYIIIDFSGFEKLIDELGGITVDVKEKIVDYKYPGPNWTYQTFKIDKGIQTLDGKTTLKYARSRHSSSDFARSERQEQIIRAIIDKIVSSGVLLDPRKLKTLYIKFTDTVKTNFDFNTLLSFVKYAKDIKIHSYNINGNCYYEKTDWKNLQPGCFVFPAKRDDFDGQAVLLPKGSNSLEVDNYKELQKFVFIALGYPELWIENSKIQILNGIKNSSIKNYYNGHLKPVASNLAYDLKNYGFNIVDVANASSNFEKNTGYIYNENKITKELLEVLVGNIQYKTGDVKYEGQGYDMTLVLGENYLDGMKNK